MVIWLLTYTSIQKACIKMGRYWKNCFYLIFNNNGFEGILYLSFLMDSIKFEKPPDQLSSGWRILSVHRVRTSTFHFSNFASDRNEGAKFDPLLLI